MASTLEKALGLLVLATVAAASGHGHGSDEKNPDDSQYDKWPGVDGGRMDSWHSSDCLGMTVTETALRPQETCYVTTTQFATITAIQTVTEQYVRTEPPVYMSTRDTLTTITIDISTATVTEPCEASTTTVTAYSPPQTVTARESFVVSECPAPTGPVAPCDDAKTNLTWGCLPGFICGQSKPEGCNLWADHPSDDFVCDPAYCIKAPPVRLTSWSRNETAYLEPNPGYFNLNPNMWGLSFDIFEQDIVIATVAGESVTSTTGNWGSQAAITHFPTDDTSILSTTTTTSPTESCTHTSPLETGVSSSCSQELHQNHKGVSKARRGPVYRRDETIFPAPCLASCENAYWIAQQVGKDYPLLCPDNTQFKLYYNTCVECSMSVYDNIVDQILQSWRITSHFSQWIAFCEGRAPDSVQSLVALSPRSIAAREIREPDDNSGGTRNFAEIFTPPTGAQADATGSAGPSQPETDGAASQHTVASSFVGVAVWAFVVAAVW